MQEGEDTMKIKKMLAGLLSATILSMATLTTFAEPIKDLEMSNNTKEPEEIMVMREKEDLGHEFKFGSFTGKVVEINDFTPIEDAKIIALEDEEGLPINMVVSNNTYVVNNDEITVSAIVTGYFDINAPMILIYPPQYSPEVVVVENQDYQVKVDIFSEELVSSDNMLKLNISEDTKVVTQDGETFKGELGNQKLVIIYTFSTKSIPAQTIPLKVIVLGQNKKEDTEKGPVGDISQLPIIVKDQAIDSLAAYVTNNKVVMVPLRPVAEALGFPVVWKGKTENIYVGVAASLIVGRDYYTFAKMVPIELGAAPELIEGITYVPLDFFTKVLQMDKAEVLKDQILIK